MSFTQIQRLKATIDKSVLSNNALLNETDLNPQCLIKLAPIDDIEEYKRFLLVCS